MNLNELIEKERYYRGLALDHDIKADIEKGKSRKCWNKANEIMLEIQQEGERQKELESGNDSNS